MAIRLQMEKKKSQEEMRRLMAERKKKDVKPGKIDNPLAKYNNAGQLMCLLCSSVVRSENVWQVHVNSKQHKNNVEQARKLKELTNNFTKVSKQKRLSPPKDAPPEKKIKGILKNTGPPVPLAVPNVNSKAPDIILHHDEEIKRAPLGKIIVAKVAKQDVSKSEPSTSSGKEPDKEQPQPDVEAPIPEGFFDDPILDAKVRNIEYKDPVEEEWEKFQKEIKEEASASAQIIAGEQEEATAERQIDEIDEQIRNWSRVLDLELKKEETKKKNQEVEQMSEDDDNESENEADIDEYLDWRAKRAYKS